MNLPESSLRDSVVQILNTVQTCVDDHGAQTATVSTSVEGDLNLIAVTPRNNNAAPVSVRISSNDAVLLTFGRTSVEIAGSDEERNQRLRSTLSSVFDGAFVEYGPGHAQSEFRMPDGSNVRIGSEKSPLQRRFGPKHKYEPYN